MCKIGEGFVVFKASVISDSKTGPGITYFIKIFR